jgi:hypothetical protein
LAWVHLLFISGDTTASAPPNEGVASFTSGETASNLGIERYGKINGLNSGTETWTGIGVVAGFLAGIGMMYGPYLKLSESLSFRRYL